MSDDFEKTVTLVKAHLSARQKRAGHSSKTFTKTITLRQDGSVGISEYDSVRTVDMKAVPFDGVSGLFEILSTLGQSPRVCVVRGQLIGVPVGEAVHSVRRLLKSKPDAPATIADLGCCWMSLDLDRIDAPDLHPIDDLAAVIGRVRMGLPSAMRDASFIWQATSGHGLKDGGKSHRLRFWYVLSRPLKEAECREWLMPEIEGLDPSVFVANQPNFCAPPVVIGGDDPIPVRMGLIEGLFPEVVPPDDIRRRPDAVPHRSGTIMSRGARARAAIETIGDHSEGRGFHSAVKHAVATVVAIFGADIDVDDLENRIVERVAEAEWCDGRLAARDVVGEIRSLIEWAINQQNIEETEFQQALADLRDAAELPGETFFRGAST